MAMTLREVRKSALALPRSKRLKLAEKLFQSISESEQEDIAAEWCAWAEARLKAYDRGETGSVNLEEFKKFVHGELSAYSRRTRR
jgi:putative addiction module component (TIGR02574 family)